MKVLALVYPGMTLLDLVGPMQAWSFLPDYEVQYAWHRSGAVRTDCGLSVQATHSFEDAWTDPDVLFVGGGIDAPFHLSHPRQPLGKRLSSGGRTAPGCLDEPLRGQQ